MKLKRHTYYGLIHKGVKALLLERFGFYNDDEYRNYLGLLMGKTSCKAMTDAELNHLIEHLKGEGFLENVKRRRPGGRGPARPSDAQWAKLAALSHERGWSGLDDPGLDAFVKRTVKIDRARFLSKSAISQVILGLERWNASGGAHAV